MSQKKNIVITGGAGFIGSHFVDAVLAGSEYDKVVVIDNLCLDTGTKDKKENIRHNLKNPRLIFRKVDIKKTKKIQKIFQIYKPEVVVHLAALADTRNAVVDPYKYLATNIDGTLNLLEASKTAGVKKFIFISSSSVYGNKNTAPFTEDMQADFAISPYGASKKAGEVLAYSYFHNFGLPIVCLRIFNAYGERMRPGLVLYKWVSSMVRGETIEISGGGTRMRDFTYVGDIVDAIFKSIEKPVGFEVLNIGNSDPLSLNSLLKIIEQVTGIQAKTKSRESHKASVEMTHADVSKALRVINWRPTTSIEDGIRKFYEWYKKNRS